MLYLFTSSHWRAVGPAEYSALSDSGPTAEYHQPLRKYLNRYHEIHKTHENKYHSCASCISWLSFK
jgi:hypothetical protein